MASGEGATTHGRASASTAREPYEEILTITVELTWLLLGAIGPTQPIGIIFDAGIAWIGDAGSTSPPLDSAGTRVVARTQPAASVATSARASIQRTGIAKGVRKTLDGEYARVSSDLVGAVAAATELDKAVLAASPADAALLQWARGKIQADITHLSIAASLLGAGQRAAVAGSVPVLVASPSPGGNAAVMASLPSMDEPITGPLPAMPSGRSMTGPAPACGVVVEDGRQSPAIGSPGAR
jgi:hypothetical protein